MPPIPSTAPRPPNESNDKSRLVQELRNKIAAMEKDLSTIFAGTAIIKKKGELALEFEKYADRKSVV